MASLVAILSGLLMSIQGVFNTRVNEKAGLWFTNAIVHGIGLITCLIVLVFVRDADLGGLKSVNKFYLLGGVLGAGIVYTVILSISKLGPAGATMLILIAQIVGSYLIQLLGLFGTEKSTFQWTKLLAVGVIAAGIVLFQWKK
ncbi:MAG: DMT family transporter [Niameybacter sp.]|uniref:DMT family transporter n=1 Tax=Niameybacter sp. TaxID=2033640 RepID=UPI002FCA7C00